MRISDWSSDVCSSDLAGEKPVPPVNYVGDFGGGGMMLAFGMASALLHAAKSGEGQVIDCAMTDGSALLAGMSWGFKAMGRLKDEEGVNMLDGGAHFYDTYACADGQDRKSHSMKSSH